nr:MAG TPA: hypothetical protein [Caudoviricetes sp.]
MARDFIETYTYKTHTPSIEGAFLLPFFVLITAISKIVYYNGN